jgi:hypothetical protein
MRESVPTRLLIQLCHASAGTLAVVERLLAEAAARDDQEAAPDSPAAPARAGGTFDHGVGKRRTRRQETQPPISRASTPRLQPSRSSLTPAAEAARSERGAQGGPAYAFRWTGRDWKVVFDGSEPFYLTDTLGARYVDYLLHQPNEPISAFDLEVRITPEKAQARSADSVQPESDARALSEYRRELHRLQEEKEHAQATGDAKEAERLEGEFEALAAALKPNCASADAGERARVNVRKAVALVLGQLRKGGPAQEAFADHLKHQLSTGYECLYSQEPGRSWG